MTHAQFPLHGRMLVSIDANLVTLDIEGPCNLEFFQDMETQMIALRPSLNLDNHTGLIILRGEALATPEAMAHFTQYLKTVKTRAVAIDLEYTFNPNTTQKLCSKAYEEAGIKHKFFYDKNKAIEWLRTCMV